jgi:hypothetical protein
MRVARGKEVDIDGFEVALKEQNGKESEHVAVFVFTPAVVHLDGKELKVDMRSESKAMVQLESEDSDDIVHIVAVEWRGKE